MSSNWVSDLNTMHSKYGFNEAVANFDEEKLRKLLEFRTKFIEEELNELKNAKTSSDVIDALIDICVVAIGTLDIFDVPGQIPWEKVFKANMSKKVGIKESRPNPLGLPDLIKPDGWKAPDHSTFDHGLLEKIFENK